LNERRKSDPLTQDGGWRGLDVIRSDVDAGLTAALIGAFEAMSDLSMNTAIVRHPNPKRKHYDTAFTLGFLRALLIAALAMLCADPLAEFYGDDRLRYVAWALAAQSIIFGFTNIGTADFQRDFTFGKDFAYIASRKLGGSIASIGFALTIWPDYRALVAGLVIGSIASVAASYILHPMRPRFGFGAFKELFGFSKWMLATNLLDFVHRRCDSLIIGKTVGLAPLGIHALAMELANLVADDFAQPLRRATMPGFAKLQDSLQELRSQFAAAYGASMMIAVPFALGVALVAEPGIRLAFGQIITLLFGAPLIWWGSVHFGLIGAAWAMSAMSAVFSLLVMRAALSLCDGKALDVLGWLPRTLMAALAMALAVWGAQAMLPYDGSASLAALNLFVSVAVGAVSYPTALLLLWHFGGHPDSTEARIMIMARGFLPARNRFSV